MKKYSIFIVEDHELFRMGINELINQEDDLFVCGESGSVHEAWQLIKKTKPDMAIIDLSLKDGDGLTLIKDISRHLGKIPILVLSMYDETLYAERVLAAGAKGYIMKQETADSIIKAIKSILKGNIYVSEKIMNSFVDKVAGDSFSSADSPEEKLSNREMEVFRLIGMGFSSGEIAKKMNLSVKTIGTYREKIKEKLKFRNAFEMVKFAISWVENNRLG